MNTCLFSLCTLCQCHCTEILIADLGHKTCVCFHSIPCVSVTALRSLYRIWDMKHMSVFMLYLVSVSLHWDSHSGFGTWNTCPFSRCTLCQCHCTKILKPDLGYETRVFFHTVPCVGITALRAWYQIWDLKHVSIPRCTLFQYYCIEILIADFGHETHVCSTLYLVSVSLHWDCHSGVRMWNICLFHTVPCVSITAARSS